VRTTAGRLLVDDALPEGLRGKYPTLDKKGTQALLRDLAEHHPEDYVRVSKRLSDVGRRVAADFGGYSFGIEHLKKAESAKKLHAELRRQYHQILDDDSLSDRQRHERILRAVGAAQQKQIDAVYEESLREKNPFALQVLSTPTTATRPSPCPSCTATARA
jgi:hypothetical protein